MRRFIAYLLMALAMLTGIGIAFNPLFSKLNAGREFTNSYEVVYTLEENDTFKPINEIEKVAAEMRSRLDKFAVEDYSVKTQGEDTISVSFAAEESEYNYIVNYLKFSGGTDKFSLIGEDDTAFAQNIFTDCVAYIEKIQDTIPCVVIPVSDKNQIEQLIKTIDETGKDDGTEKSSRVFPMADGEDESEESKPNIFLVHDWDSGDSYELIQKDPHVAEKLMMSFSTSSIWKNDDHNELQFVVGTMNSENQYDLTALKSANIRARYLMNTFNASDYKVNVKALYVNESAGGVVYNYNTVKATHESLLSFSNDVNVAMSVTLISTLIAIAIVSLLVAVFFRISAVAVVCNTLGSAFLTYLLFITMGGLFNIPAFIGGILLTVTSLFGQIFYLNKFKDEVYKGRTIRKANQEAAKKSTIIHIDAAVITAFAGLMLYVIGGEAIKPMGIVLFFGSIIVLLMNLIIFRFMMYLVTNTTLFANKYNLFGIEEKNVPSILEDKKEEAVAPYEKVNFTKHSKIYGIIVIALSIAAVVGISVFGAIKGSPLNVENVTKDYSALYVSIKSDNSVIVDEQTFNDRVLKFIQIDGKNISIDNKAISYQKVSLFDSETQEVEIEPTHVFRANLNGVVSPKEVKYTLDYTSEDPVYEVAADGLEEAIENVIMDVENISLVDKISVSNKVSHETVTTPSQTRIAVAAIILIAGASIYMMFRFRISRGLAALVVAASSSLIAYGVLALTRLATTPVAAIAMPVVGLTALLLSSYYFLKEKEMIKDSKEDLTLEARSSLMKKAVALAATSTIILSVLVVYLTINYFGFGLANLSYMFADILLGDVVAIASVLIILGPLSMLFEKLLKKIRLPKFARKEKKQRIKLHEQPKTSEPEERIYIGIND